MKTNAISENPAFLQEAFRDDINALGQLDATAIQGLTQWLNEAKDYRELEDDKRWTTLAVTLRQSIDEVRKCFRPVRFMAAVSVEDRIPVPDLLDDLVEVGAIEGTDTGLREALTNLLEPVVGLMKKAYDETAPSLPLLRIKGLGSRCAAVYEFENEFNTKTDAPDTYQPRIKKPFPVATLKLTFRDDAHKPIGISLSEEDLDAFITWLELTREQLRTVAQDIRGESKRS